MSEKKTIQINPELFRFSTNKTRKRSSRDGEQKPIRVKGQPRPVSNKTAKRRLLKYIRQQQEKNYQQMVEGKPLASSENEEFESDFENSLKYLASVAEKNKQSVKHNQTLRHLPSSESLFFRQNTHNAENDYVETELPVLFDNDAPLANNNNVPKYGCLKNGQLPTYRMWKNQTQKTTPHPVSNTHTFYTLSTPFQQPAKPVSQMADDYLASESPENTIASFTQYPPASNVSSFVRDKMEELKRHREIRERREKIQIPLVRNRKQKKTTRRTFRVGKSKHYSQVAVLVSNKTMRKQVSTKIQLLKQVPIEDVRKSLVKKGLIRVGSTAPNDVLRKMYESTSLVCGEVQNHNPENLLYNYLNAATM